MHVNSKWVFLWLFLAGFGAPLQAQHTNFWPFFTGERSEDGAFREWQAAGPLLFQRTRDNTIIRGLRPLYISYEDRTREETRRHVLYPLINHKEREEHVSWDVFTLLRYQRITDQRAGDTTSIDLFPFLFWRQAPDPAASYFGVFPIAGNVRHRFAHDRIQWFLFPLYGRFEERGVTKTTVLWPFFKHVTGDEARGFDFWPFYGFRAQEGRFERHFFLWPLGYHVRRDLWEEVPFEAFGILPFYSRSRSATAESETYLWPFFGYTRSFEPEYYETRYFWPLFVHREGEHQRTVRLAPFFTHRERPGYRKNWILWPLYRFEETHDRGLIIRRDQVLYFLYWNLEQRIAGRPEAPPARKSHLWPLFSYWDNGAGRRQMQFLSPFEVFFPHSEVVRDLYSPLFSLYRYESLEENDAVRHSALFDLIRWKRKGEHREFQLGPLLTIGGGDDESEFEVLKGLFRHRKRAGEKREFRLFWLDISRE